MINKTEEEIDQHIKKKAELIHNAKEAMRLNDLRDQFAMAALTGLLASKCTLDSAPHAVREAYEAADEMLKAREKI